MAKARRSRSKVRKREISVPSVPPPPSVFSRGIVVTNLRKLIFLSGTCSHRAKDIRGQTLEVYENITTLLKKAGATWNDVVRCLLFLKDIDRDFNEFDKVRREFFKRQGIKPPYPASTGVQAKMVHPRPGMAAGDEFLIEMEVTAVV